MDRQKLGAQELEVLRYVAANAPISVGQVAERYGEPRGLARTTILTMMERLRTKGYLVREGAGRAFKYSPRVPQQEVLRGLVRQFVEKTLAGSLTPFVAYLAEERDLSDEEITELQRLVSELQTERKGRG